MVDQHLGEGVVEGSISGDHGVEGLEAIGDPAFAARLGTVQLADWPVIAR